MKQRLKHTLKILMSVIVLGMSVSSCTDLIFDDREGCDRGVFVKFNTTTTSSIPICLPIM